jgi:REP element-mobilizing transposase RayT
MTYYERNLPHWQPPGKDIFLTWRLHGSLPARINLPDTNEYAGKRFLAYDRALDSATVGPLWLKDPPIAEAIIAALQKGQADAMFRLHAYTILANHVHILIEPRLPVARITKIIKGRTAREANRILNRESGRFWQDESFDHWIRSTAQWQRVRSYIELNPVKAGLVAKPQDWPWSSASRPLD